MNSKEALDFLNHLISREKHIDSERNKKINECYNIIKKDLNRLEKHESIKEELGIDLIKAVELCKQVNIKKVVYTKDEWGYYPIKFIDELDIELFSHRLYKNARGICLSLDLYDYGKTWALTKEELENDN